MYGDAEETVSISRLTNAPATTGATELGITELRYLNDVVPSVVDVRTSFTTNEPL